MLPLAPLLEFAAPANLARPLQAWAVVTAAVLWAWKLGPGSSVLRRPRTFLLLLGAGSSSILAGSVFSPHQPFTGDEPAYLVMASGLAGEGDLELIDNYRAEQWRDFGVAAYRPFLDRGADGKLYPHHGPGLGLLLAPFVALYHEARPALGSEAGILLLRLLAGLAIGLGLGIAYQLAVERGAEPRHALGASAAAGLSCPLLFYSTQLYPDVPAFGLLALLALRQPPSWAALAALILLPQLGVKFVPAAAVLGGSLVLRCLGTGRRGPALLAGAGLVAGLAAFFWTKPPLDVQAHLTSDVGARLWLVPWWLHGYLLDQRAGLIFLAPIYLIALAGLRSLRLRAEAPILLAVAAYLGVYAYHLDWGGLCPPGRPLVAVAWLPVMLVALGLKRVGSATARGLTILSALLGAAYVLDHRALYLHLHPNAQLDRSPLLEEWSLPSIDLTRMAPFVSADHTWTLANVVWLGLLLVAGWLLSRPAAVPRPRREAAGLLGLLAAILLWASATDPTSRLPALRTGVAQLQLYTELGNAWADGWIPPDQSVSVWVARDRPFRLCLQSLVETEVRVRGRGMSLSLKVRPDAPAFVDLPAPETHRPERLVMRCSVGVVPAEVSGSGDRRRLGVRVSVAR